jgi:hypothetical protein
VHRGAWCKYRAAEQLRLAILRSKKHCTEQFNMKLGLNRITYLDHVLGNTDVGLTWMAFSSCFCAHSLILTIDNDIKYTLRTEDNMERKNSELDLNPRLLWDSISHAPGRAIAKAVSRRLPTAAVRVRTRVTSCGIFGGQNDTGWGFLWVLRFPLPILIPPIDLQWPSSVTIGQ